MKLERTAATLILFAAFFFTERLKEIVQVTMPYDRGVSVL